MTDQLIYAIAYRPRAPLLTIEHASTHVPLLLALFTQLELGQIHIALQKNNVPLKVRYRTTVPYVLGTVD